MSVFCSARALAFGGSTLVQITEEEANPRDLIGLRGFVPFVVPGESVEVAISKRKDRFFEGDALRILQSSDARVEPPCPVFGSCGGCDYQHIDYAAQREFKHEMILGSFKAGRLPDSVLELVKPVVESAPYEYRRRISLHIDKLGRVGFYHRKSHEVIPIANCPISTTPVNTLLKSLSEFSKQLSGFALTAKIEADDDSGTIVFMATDNQVAETVSNLARGFFSRFAVLLNGKPFSEGGVQELSVVDDFSGRRAVPAGSFSQVNWEVNQQLVKRVVEIVTSLNVKSVEDLYSGCGNFAIPLGLKGISVEAVESDERLCAVGSEEAKRLQISDHLNFHHSSVEAYLKKLHPKREVDFVVADPPRSGAKDIIRALTRTSHLILISCHLPSCVRDLKDLIQSGWQVQTIEPFDMFPQTTYVEIMSVLTR